METVGTLNLKIARLERYLQLLSQQQLLSGPYPGHKEFLSQKSCQVRFQLDRLKQYREQLLDPHARNYTIWSSFEEEFKNRGKTNFSLIG